LSAVKWVVFAVDSLVSGGVATTVERLDNEKVEWKDEWKVEEKVDLKGKNLVEKKVAVKENTMEL